MPFAEKDADEPGLVALTAALSIQGHPGSSQSLCAGCLIGLSLGLSNRVMSLKRRILKFGLSLVGPIALIVILTMPIGLLGGGLGIVQPIGGIFDAGRTVDQPVTQTIRLTGLTSQVDVIVDRWGIPHIYAESSYDAFMALGYMHAKERLFQMYIQNHLAAGRISEVIGSASRYITSDMFYRTIGLSRSAQITLDSYVATQETDPDIAYALNVIDAECAGINTYIDSMTPTDLPIEFKLLGVRPEHWTRHDVFLWCKMMTWGLSGSTYDLLRYWMRTTIDNDTMYYELFPDTMPYSVPIIPEQTNLSHASYPDAPGGYPASLASVDDSTDAEVQADLIPLEKLNSLISMIDEVIAPFGSEDLVGSNNWVVNGSRTSTGMPLLANDPHLGLQAPSLWYEAHIVIPGELEVSGVTLPGTPGVLLGHNAHTAWGLTNVGLDVFDMFVEQLNPSDADQYMYNGEYRDFTTIDEPIRTRDGTTIPFSVKVSVHGPLIDSVMDSYGLDSNDNPNIAMNWTGNSVTHEVLALTKINKMQNLQDYYDAMYWWDSPPQNIVFADDVGNIAITVAGRYPIRAGYTGEFPVMATNDSVGMVGNIPYAYIPRSVNPAQGYLQSANQLSIDPAEYGFALLGPQDDGYRGRRIDSLLAADSNVTVSDMKRFQADSLEVRAQVIVPYVIAAWDSEGGGNETVSELVDLLREWDYVMETDLVAPTFWMFVRNAMHYEVFDELTSIDPTLMPSRTPILEKLLKENDTYYFDDHRTVQVETRDEIIVRSIYKALDDMVAEFGSDPDGWVYGLHHRVFVNHVALGSAFYIGGGPHRGQNTLNAAGGWSVTHGPSWRMVADLGNIEQSYGVYPGGQSGNMFSHHWDDLFDLWYAYDPATEQYGYHLMYFYSTAAAFQTADTEHTMIERTVTFVP